jgi:hypothetical protein
MHRFEINTLTISRIKNTNAKHDQKLSHSRIENLQKTKEALKNSSNSQSSTYAAMHLS